MGYYKEGNIDCYKPDDTPDELWIPEWGSIDFDDLFQRMRNHFGPDINFSDFCIGPEYVHTRCLTYDCYDPTDYTTYLRITRKTP